MREIKFRAWEPYELEMSYEPEFMAFHGMATMEADWILLQYTGLRDKNGADIYEGDVVETIDGELVKRTYTVEYSGEHTAFRLRSHVWPKASYQMVRNNMFIEVLGNVYENSELLPS